MRKIKSKPKTQSKGRRRRHGNSTKEKTKNKKQKKKERKGSVPESNDWVFWIIGEKDQSGREGRFHFISA